LRLNFVAVCLDETKNRARRAGKSGECRINPTVSNFLIDGGTVRFNNTLTYGGNFSRRIAHPLRQPTFSRTFSLSGGTVMFNSGNTLTLPNTTTLAGGSITGGTLALNGNTEVNGSTLIQATVFQTTARSG
jgi:hypothetical protein